MSNVMEEQVMKRSVREHHSQIPVVGRNLTDDG
jgi:hypothetical protein